MGQGSPSFDQDPQFIQFPEEMPYNETGKLLRRVLRET